MTVDDPSSTRGSAADGHATQSSTQVERALSFSAGAPKMRLDTAIVYACSTFTPDKSSLFTESLLRRSIRCCQIVCVSFSVRRAPAEELKMLTIALLSLALVNSALAQVVTAPQWGQCGGIGVLVMSV
jgi:hypothetical protein